MSSPYEALRELVGRISSDQKLLTELTKKERRFQFRPTDGAPFYLHISPGSIAVHEGETNNPTATVIAASSDLIDVFRGQADPFKLFFSGKLRVQGNLLEAQELARILGSARG
ncbi:MAG: SCP2 sterol-binding domain-containing protein [Nitrososphaerota archaeon]